MKRIEVVGELAGMARDVACGEIGLGALSQRLRALLVAIEGVGGAQGAQPPPLALPGAPGRAPTAPEARGGGAGAPRGAPGATQGQGGAFGAPPSALALVPQGGVVLAVPDAPDPLPEREVRMRGAVDRLFAFWVRETGRSPSSTKKTPERVKAIRARLRDGYTESDIRRAIANIAQSDFHQGEKGTRYDDLTLICRNGSHLEKYRDMSDAEPSESDVDIATATLDEALEARRKKIKKQLAKAMKEGRHDEYAALQDKLRRIDASA